MERTLAVSPRPAPPSRSPRPAVSLAPPRPAVSLAPPRRLAHPALPRRLARPTPPVPLALAVADDRDPVVPPRSSWPMPRRLAPPPPPVPLAVAGDRATRDRGHSMRRPGPWRRPVPPCGGGGGRSFLIAEPALPPVPCRAAMPLAWRPVFRQPPRRRRRMRWQALRGPLGRGAVAASGRPPHHYHPAILPALARPLTSTVAAKPAVYLEERD
nr:formin-like protein 3 [Aegilops tauschii subsp. strangulata]